MRELLGTLERWLAEGKSAAVARVVDIAGSAPREPGAAMAVANDSEIIGSVSGGCVEGAVVEAAEHAMATGEGALLSFGYSDTDAFAVGLTCGGTIQLFVEPFAWDGEVRRALASALAAEEAVALATVIAGPNTGAKLLLSPGGATVGGLGDPALDEVVARDASGELAAGTTRARHYGPHGEAWREDLTVFIESFVPPPRMIIFGAIDFSAALVKVAHVVGFRVTVCDARTAFATKARFPLADEVIADWPQRHLGEVGQTLTQRDAICVLTHDPKFDVPAIVSALETDVGYIGVMGSRRTHRERLERLLVAGVDADGIARLHSPIGLDLGARTPEETAISICAEIIAARAGRERIVPLKISEGSIHARTTGESA
jgi:xanthine dehydrogenase accessory factor